MKRKPTARFHAIQICLIGFGFCCLAIFRADAENTIIDFGNPAGYSVLYNYSEDGYSISTYRMEVGYDFDRPPHLPLQGGLANVQAWFKFTRDDGNPFQCLSLDLRTVPYNSAGTYTGNIVLEGDRIDGSKVYQSISFSQGWTTFTLPPTFTDLSQIFVGGGYFALDNIVVDDVTSIPEPTSCGFLAVTAILFHVTRQRRRLSRVVR